MCLLVWTSLLAAASLLFTGCGVLRDSAKYDFNDGTYRRTFFGGKPSRVYISTREGTIAVYAIARTIAGDSALPQSLQQYPAAADTLVGSSHHHNFFQPSFDLDVLTIPFRYRAPVRGFPSQLGTAFTGALYFGYRTDGYRISYRRTPLREYRRHLSHYGYSGGFFAGLGATPVNPWVTQPAIADEYDGLVFNVGLAGIVAVNDLSFGLGVGTDRLMDLNRRVWIYRDQAWVGVMLGLNLN